MTNNPEKVKFEREKPYMKHRLIPGKGNEMESHGRPRHLHMIISAGFYKADDGVEYIDLGTNHPHGESMNRISRETLERIYQFAQNVEYDEEGHSLKKIPPI